MEKLKQEIHRVKRYNLEYYQSHLSLIESYIEEKPDISIETCKAVIEGISILALFLLKQEPINSHNNDNLQELFKRALSELQKGRGFSDVDMVKRVGSVVHYLGELRNSHCDIGHGRASLKDQVNDTDFADFIVGITDNLCTYMLRRLDKLSEEELQYEDSPTFNEYLDEVNPMPGKILFSKALFEQEFETYEIQLGDYMLEEDLKEE